MGSSSQLRESLARNLVSKDGDIGLDRLVGRVEPHMAGLLRAWEDRDFLVLGPAIERCAKESDALDLSAADFKLRCGRIEDTYVCSKIYEALLEYLSDLDESAIFEVAQTISYIDEAPKPFAFDYIMRLLLIRLQLRRGLTQDAIATANCNLSVLSSCSHTQYHLYVALLQQRTATGLTDSPNVALQNLSDRFCSQPFNTLASSAGRQPNLAISGPYTKTVPNLYACHCPGILPYPVNDGTDTQGIDEIWNGAPIQEIRRSILDGDFTYCSRLNCPEILGGTLPKKDEITDPRLRDIIDNRKVILDDAPLTISLSHDPSCNLACPSCRLDILNINNKQREDLDRFSDRILLPLMEDAPVTLILSTDGDPFGSKHYRHLMRSFDPSRHSKVRIQFLTNGLLLTAREWDELTNLHSMVGSVSVSIDAAEASTYEDLRRPGKWSVITENMENLSRLRRAGKVPYVSLNFVVQKKNYRQMPAFVEMTKAWGFDRALFLKLINIGSFTTDQFVENNVCDPRHPEYQEFLAVLREPIMQSAEAELYTVKPYLAIAQAARQDIVAALPSSPATRSSMLWWWATRLFRQQSRSFTT